jgi:hypothetical protein
MYLQNIEEAQIWYYVWFKLIGGLHGLKTHHDVVCPSTMRQFLYIVRKEDALITVNKFVSWFLKNVVKNASCGGSWQ